VYYTQKLYQYYCSAEGETSGIFAERIAAAGHVSAVCRWIDHESEHLFPTDDGVYFPPGPGHERECYSIVQLGRVRDVTQSITLEDNVLLDLHKSLTNAFLKETQNEKNFITLRDAAFYDSFLLAWRDFEKNSRKRSCRRSRNSPP